MTPRRIVCFGASTIYGSIDEELGGVVNRLRFWSEAQDPRNRVYNLGIWGEQTKSLISRLTAEAEIRRPDLIIIYPGFNDCRRIGSRDSVNVVSLKEFKQLMLELIRLAQTQAPTLMLTGYPFDESRTAPIAGTTAYYLFEDAEKYSATLVEAAAEQGADVIDFFSELKNRDLSDLLSADGLHGNAKCHQLLFERIKEYLSSK